MDTRGTLRHHRLHCQPHFPILSPSPTSLHLLTVAPSLPRTSFPLPPHTITLQTLPPLLTPLHPHYQASGTSSNALKLRSIRFLHFFLLRFLLLSVTALSIPTTAYPRSLSSATLFFCPSSFFHPHPSLLDSLHYPQTLQTSHELLEKNSFLQILDDSKVELCFSLDDYCVNFNSNFFYKDCPGVVSCNDLLNCMKPMLRMPGVLAAECANFVASGDGTEILGFSRDCIKFIPSEMQLVRTETEAWNDYPASYSYTVLRAFLCLNTSSWNDLISLVLVNSPRYGVVIDVPMRDHIALLFRLSFKAIIREAIRLANSLIKEDIRDLTLKSTSFNCPVLVEAMMWLVSQLSILYGEFNGKFFALHILKQCLLSTLTNYSLFPFVQRTTAFKQVDKKSEEQNEENMDMLEGETIEKSLVFVSQVAASVVALHERSSLEMKIRESTSLTTYQKFAEHANISKGADGERQKRTNYRPILEYDGFLWQRSNNEESNKIKTREELLAEERDYKRRRMSYRGKKVKRSYLQVMRDIIDEYMEEAKQAGGIDCLLNGVENSKRFAVESPSICDSYLDGDETNKGLANSSDTGKGQSHAHGKQFFAHYDSRKNKFGNNVPEDDKSSCDSDWHHKRLETPRRISGQRDEKYYSRYLDEKVSNSCQFEVSHRGWRDDTKISGKYFRHSPSQSHRRSHEQNNYSREKVHRNSELKDKWTRSTHQNHGSESATLGACNDRYDPYESLDTRDDDVYS